jgi:phage anti-repressor protein
MKKMKKLVLRYPDGRSLYKHPETAEEFKKLFDRMRECKKINDIDGVFTCAMQLIPTVMDVQ